MIRLSSLLDPLNNNFILVCQPEWLGRKTGTIHSGVILPAYRMHACHSCSLNKYSACNILSIFSPISRGDASNTTVMIKFHIKCALSVSLSGCSSSSVMWTEAEGTSVLTHVEFYLFWWCCTTHRAGVCCLLQCPAAAPCSCWVRTPRPAYSCPGTAGRKTHRYCNSAASP